VVESSAQGKISRGTWDARLRGVAKPRQRQREYITASRPQGGVGEVRSSEEAGNDRGAKGPY